MRIETQTGYLINETATVYGQSKYIGIHALAAVVNSMAAAGASHPGVGVRIALPPYAYKSKIHTIEKNIKSACREQEIELLEIKSERNSAVNFPMVAVSGIAKVPKNDPWCKGPVPAKGEIVLTKWVGMDGMLQIIMEKERELRERFAPAFLNQILSYRQEIFARQEIGIARACGASAICQIGDGGILAALWNLAKEASAGISVDMKQISILQETIEVCEHYRLNPYQLASAGSLLIIADDGEALAEALNSRQVKASVIGRLTDNNDKIIHNGEEVRYIDRPAPDEILKLFNGGRQDERDEETDTDVYGDEQQSGSGRTGSHSGD
ncbi:AIR synthase-related protein [[Clostridium] scindens]|uniref:AIR synthase-related protein n=1 Tax=Clostridium scindens (strain JCM 10418 / VPI 12708) TaxID=29347 RepID=UPI0032C0FB4B